MTKKTTFCNRPPIRATACPKSTWASPGGCISGMKTSFGASLRISRTASLTVVYPPVNPSARRTCQIRLTVYRCLRGMSWLASINSFEPTQPGSDHRLLDWPASARYPGGTALLQDPLQRVPVNAEPLARRPLGNPLHQHRSSNVCPLFHVRIHSCLTPFVWDGLIPSHPKLRELLPRSATKLPRPPRATVLLRPLPPAQVEPYLAGVQPVLGLRGNVDPIRVHPGGVAGLRGQHRHADGRGEDLAIAGVGGDRDRVHADHLPDQIHDSCSTLPS